MKRFFSALTTLLLVCSMLGAQERVPVWPKGKMPDTQAHQIAAMTDESEAPGFKPDKHRIPYLEWFEKPANPNGACMILISGGSYQNCCDVNLIDSWHKELTALGFQCVNFVYRTPRPVGLPIYQTAWEDGQRAVRLVRREAAKRGFDPEKIGVISMSAGSHLALLLATSSQTSAYAPIDKVDQTPCHINWAIVNAPAYVTTDAETGIPASREGYGSDVKLSQVFQFDDKTCPMSLHHGENDPYSPNGSTLVYRQLRRMGIPAELHLYPNKGHGAFGFERGVEFMNQMGFTGPVAPGVDISDRYTEDTDRGQYILENIWPEGQMPDVQENQGTPYIEWHFPKERKTGAIQIIYSGGAYSGNGPGSFEVAPARRYLNAKGITVVTMRYRTPRPEGLAKHTSAWQDLQRAIRVVRSQAAGYGLDPDRIGIMGSSAGGHLTLMGVTSSRHRSYLPIDEIDQLSCKVQWGIGIYPAYALTDGLDVENTAGGNEDSAVLAPEFSFDPDTAPMLLIHGDADGWAAMNSVKVWEKLRSMGIPSELHTLALRPHCFMQNAAPGTGSYTYLDRIGEFLEPICQEVPVKEGAIVPYIPEDKLPDVVQILPAPPKDPSPDFDYDIIRYKWGKEQRKDSLRLAMAVRDAIWSLDTTFTILGEPFGLKISKTETPAIYEVLTRGVTTIENIRYRPKAYYFRTRPFAYFKEPSIFPQDDEWLATEGSYPSGHTIRAWACALLMAQINPSSAEAVFARAWESGESRVISGCHWQSDVNASRPVAGIGYSRLQTSPEFQQAMARAQEEIRRLTAASR